MYSAVSAPRGGNARLLQSSPRWLHKKTTITSPSPSMLNQVNTSFSPAFFPASGSNSPGYVHGNHFYVASSWPRSNSPQPSLFPLMRSQRTTAGRTETESPLLVVPVRSTSSMGLSFPPAVSPVGSSSASLTPTSSLLCTVPSCHRLFASKTPSSSSSARGTPTAGASEQLTVQVGEQQDSHEVEKRHGDELKNFYHIHSDHHGDPRHHINPDGTLKFQTTAESFHWENDAAATPAQEVVSVNGKKMIKGVETRDFVELFQIYQKNIPFWPRTRLSTWGNHDLLMKAEFLFFWVPTFIIWSLAVPMFTMLYMSDEAIYASMTVKVIGRQWYWIYEIESPVDEDE